MTGDITPLGEFPIAVYINGSEGLSWS